MSVSPREHSVSVGNGRRITIAEWGDLQGFPVVRLHSTPGSRLSGDPGHPVFAENHIRLITFDRPGYGGSDRWISRRVIDTSADVARIADSLHIDMFAVMGASGGGPYALACAAGLAGRVVAAAAVQSLAPFDAPGLDFAAGLPEDSRQEIAAALAGLEELEVLFAPFAAGVATDPASDPALREAVRQGVAGLADDTMAFTSPWGFDVASITVPVVLCWRDYDTHVPAAHGEYLLGAIPTAREVRFKDGTPGSSEEVSAVLTKLLEHRSR